MTKKRLSDLLRDEAKKAPEAIAANPADAATSDSTSNPAETALVIEVVAEPIAEPWDEPPAPADEPPAAALTADDAHAPARAKSASHPTKADLQAALNTLEADLAAAHQREAHLTQEIDTLQTTLAERQTSIEKLQTELDQAKQVILQLSAVNIKPKEPTPPPAATPEPAKAKAPVAPRQELAIQQRVNYRPTAPLPLPRMSTESDTRLSEIDIGWVD